eukprot:CAMPEP_0194323484 /NCGR_PEP_ID=MMETSP0171-20130528/25777_1 /TAXON_ID=218684 /ORGANISM="Corethron pennatum, Strain L29A3" /LENGTH=293 /DNA_ID=CAMNT_0039082143 /DNA_START=66 /DNA_END=947 /DNA_ORIENTATION=+
MTDEISNNIRLSESLLPRTSITSARQSSYIKATSNDEDNNDTSEGGCMDTLYMCLGSFFNFFSLVTMIIPMLVPDMQIAAALSLGIVVFNNLFGFFMYKIGKTRSWPKPLDVILFILFLVQAISVWFMPKSEFFWRFWGGSYFGFLLWLFSAIFWYFGSPIMKPLTEDMYGIIGATHPTAMFGIRWTTGVFMTASFLQGVLFLPTGIQFQLGNYEKAWSLMIWGAIGGPVAVVLAIVFSLYGLPWYMDKYKFSIFDRYKTEITEWNEAHPDELFAKLAEEYVVNDATATTVDA